jgi:hypothetical protein
VKQELDAEADLGRGPAVDPAVGGEAVPAVLFRGRLVLLPLPLAVARRDFRVLGPIYKSNLRTNLNQGQI